MGPAGGGRITYDRPVDDAELVRAATGGDRDAFAAIYDRYAARLHDFAFSVLRDPHSAADILQDTFILAGSRLHQLRDPAKLRPWLYAITRHLALREVKRRKRSEPVEEVEVTERSRNPEERAEADDLAALVWAAAEGLNARERTVLDLHLRQGLEGRDLGDALGVSPSQAYVMMSRLRNQVERSLGALLVARQGRRDCADLEAVLSGWDGAYTTVWRKRVARHVDGCATCSGTLRRVGSALAIFGATPALALPADLRDRIVANVHLASHTGRPWPAEGFPPPTPAPRRRRFAMAASAVAGVALLGSVASGLGDGGDATRVVAGSTTNTTTTTAGALGSTPSPALAEGGLATSVPASTTSTTSAPSLPAGPPAPVTAAPSPRAPPTTPGASTTPGSASTDPATTTTTAPRSTTATTSITTRGGGGNADIVPPTISSVRLDPSRIRSNPQCRGDDPTTSTVSVAASDASGVAGVTVAATTPENGDVSMTPGRAGIWTATVGPFPSVTRAPAEVILTVVARDGAGNTATAQATLQVRCG